MRDPAFFRSKAGRRDSNHAAIRDGLRKLGHMVIDTAAVGDGIPDMCVYPRDVLGKVDPSHWVGDEFSHVPPAVWLEVKVGKGKLRASQVAWRAQAEARGIRVATVRSLDEALAVLGGGGA